MPNRQPYTFDRVVRIVFSICIVLTVIWMLDVLRGVLLPFLVACLIAYMLEPIVRWNQRWTHSKRRFIPVVLTLVEALCLVGIFCWIFIPYLVSECKEMARLISAYASREIQIPYISDKIHKFIRDNVDFDTLSRYLTRDQWIELAKTSLSKTWSFVSSGVAVVAAMVSWLIVILYVIFIMLDYERLMLSFRQLVPYRHRKTAFRIFDDIKNSMNRYFRGQFIIAMTVGILFAIGFLIVGLPMGVILGLFIGVLNMVPYLQVISLPICALLCLVAVATNGVDFWVIFWESMAVYVIVQSIQDLILTPKIMGKVMGLNPAIILLSLSVWGCLLGFIGLIIALPLTTLLLSYYDMYIVRRDGDTLPPNNPDNPVQDIPPAARGPED
ncbi:MAG: AI-2E family transporter [Bacteroides sp.]|nr:AI-2E family transporter [Bacteroides sp.]